MFRVSGLGLGLELELEFKLELGVGLRPQMGGFKHLNSNPNRIYTSVVVTTL